MDRTLIQLLNQRYHHEFLRAERLAADLALVQRFRASFLCKAYRWLSDKFRRDRVTPTQAVPLSLKPVETSGRVSIIIPFRDQGALLRDCLRSLRGSTYRRFEMVLIDNGSTDPSLLRLLQRLKTRRRYRVVHDPSPFNFSRLCNLGARKAKGDWLLFLNNDTSVLTPDWLESMITAASQPNVGIAGATLFYPDGTIQHDGMFLRGDGVWDHFHRGETQPWSDIHQVPAVTAACLMISRPLFDALHGFDESRPVTFNDVDLCFRARSQGHKVVIVPQARLLHYESLSRGYTPLKERYLSNDNRNVRSYYPGNIDPNSEV